MWGAITGVAVSLGPILGGAITTEISWRGIFLVNVPVGIVALLLTLGRVEESRAPHPDRPDWIGFALLTAGLVGLVYGLIRASETSWGDSGVVASLSAGGVLLLAFILAEWRVSEPMFDLSLFRIPTFTGGLIAAFTMNGSLFALYLYLVLYLQDVLRFSALSTGLRLLVSTGGLFVAAVVSGRLSEHVPIRLLIGPGLTLVGVGLLIMTGLSGTSSWTRLLPGLIVSGFGAGLVNPPLASTSIGVVTPERAGMASGVNSTARQVGFATAIAAYGSIFLSALRRHLDQNLAATPSLARRAHTVAIAVRQGSVSHLITTTPPALRGRLEGAIRAAFAHGIDDLALISGGVALVGALGAFVLIRGKDFVHRQQPGAPSPGPASGDDGLTGQPA